MAEDAPLEVPVLVIPATQPLDRQHTDDNILCYAAALCRKPESIEERTQTADLVTALLELSKLSARVACELHGEVGTVPRDDFKRAYVDLNGFVTAVNTEFKRALATASTPSHASSDLSPPPPNQEQAHKKTQPLTREALETLTDSLLEDPRLIDAVHDRLYDTLQASLQKELLSSLHLDLLTKLSSPRTRRYSGPEGRRTTGEPSTEAGPSTTHTSAPARHTRWEDEPLASSSGPKPSSPKRPRLDDK